MAPIIGITCAHSVETSGRFYVNEAYVRSIEVAGAVPLLIPAMRTPENVISLLERVGGVLLPGGIDVDPMYFGEEPISALGNIDPDWDELELTVARTALEWDMPILGICRGIQLINIAAGGTIYQDIPTQIKGQVLQHAQKAPCWHPTHEITIESGSMMEQMLGTDRVRVNSFHHQAVKMPAPGFRVTAKTKDGVIEAIESRNHTFACGVQWHPEHMVDRYVEQLGIFRYFVQAAERHRRHQRVAG